MIYTWCRLAPSSTVEEKERNENYPAQNEDPQDVVIVLGICTDNFSIIVFLHWLLFGRSNVEREAQYTNTKAAVKQLRRDGPFEMLRTGRKYR